jgi:hypothetical protein
MGAIISSPPLVGNFISMSVLFASTLFQNQEYHHKFVVDYKYAVRSIAFTKLIISGAMIGYSLRDGDLYHKGEEQKCFKESQEIPCYDSDKVSSCLLGEVLAFDAVLDLSLKIHLSDIFII